SRRPRWPPSLPRSISEAGQLPFAGDLRLKRKKPRRSGAFCILCRSGSDAEIGELVLELRKTAAAVDQVLLAAGPGRVRVGVNVEVERVALLAPGRARLVLGAVGHHDLDGMIFGMNVGFHGVCSCWKGVLQPHLRRCRPV